MLRIHLVSAPSPRGGLPLVFARVVPGFAVDVLQVQRCLVILFLLCEPPLNTLQDGIFQVHAFDSFCRNAAG
jgi:hypothetical protein